MPISECGSEAAVLEFRQKGGSFSAALHGRLAHFDAFRAPEADRKPTSDYLFSLPYSLFPFPGCIFLVSRDPSAGQGGTPWMSAEGGF